MGKLLTLVTDPRKFFRLAAQTIEKRLASHMVNQAFFLQGQMDVNPLGKWHRKDFVETTGGFFIPGDPVDRQSAPFYPWDLVRRDMLMLLMRSLNERKIQGDMAELGVWQAITAKLFHYYNPDRALHLFDTFEGFHEKDIASEREKTGLKASTSQFSNTSVDAVLSYIKPRNSNVVVHKGFFPNTIPPELYERTFALVHLDADLYDPILAGLKFFYPRMAKGGFLLVHDFNAWPGARLAAEEFFADKPETPVPMPDKSGTLLVAKR